LHSSKILIFFSSSCGAPRPESASIISNQFNALRNEIRPGGEKKQKNFI